MLLQIIVPRVNKLAWPKKIIKSYYKIDIVNIDLVSANHILFQEIIGLSRRFFVSRTTFYHHSFTYYPMHLEVNARHEQKGMLKGSISPNMSLNLNLRSAYRDISTWMHSSTSKHGSSQSLRIIIFTSCSCLIYRTPRGFQMSFPHFFFL